MITYYDVDYRKEAMTYRIEGKLLIVLIEI